MPLRREQLLLIVYRWQSDQHLGKFYGRLCSSSIMYFPLLESKDSRIINDCSSIFFPPTIIINATSCEGCAGFFFSAPPWGKHVPAEFVWRDGAFPDMPPLV